MRVVTFSVTAAGADLARRLPYEHRAGGLIAAVAEEWDRCDGLVVIAATGIAVRAIAPHLADKRRDPAVVCVDDTGRFVVALTGGHAGGANQLARQVAAHLGGDRSPAGATAGPAGPVAVVSTATDGAGRPALDDLPGLVATGDVAAVTRRWLDGEPPRIEVDPALADWPLPAALADGGPTGPDGGPAGPDGGPAGPDGAGRGDRPGGGSTLVTVTDAARPAAPLEVLLRPASLVLGVGSSRGADRAGLAGAVADSLARAGVDVSAVGAVATVDLKADEEAIVALASDLGVPLETFPAGALAGQAVPNPSAVVADAVGTPSVAEAAALLAAGPGAVLIGEKRVAATGDSTVAVARRRRPSGHLAVVGLGPGHPDRRTPEATAAVRHAEVVIGYAPYVDQAADLLRPSQEVVRSPIGAEAERTRQALERAAAGHRVALVCSGDPGVYAMASLACELAPAAGNPPMTVVPGVTAALAGAAVLGSPLGHDHASISLSDLLTPWEVIVRRIRAVAEGDFVVSLYNPKSMRRVSQLPEAIAILLGHRPPSTPAAVLTDIGRPGQHVIRTTLAGLDPDTVGMLSLVVIGSSQTRWIGDRMVTPRGYLG